MILYLPVYIQIRQNTESYTPFTRSKIIWIMICFAIWISIQIMYPSTWDTHCSIQQSASHYSSLFSHCKTAIHLLCELKLSRSRSSSSVYTGQNFSIHIAIYFAIQIFALCKNWIIGRTSLAGLFKIKLE